MPEKTPLTEPTTGWKRALLALTRLVCTTPLSSTPLPSDFTSDGEVGLDDFFLFATAFNSTSGTERYDPVFDLDTDGIVGLTDFLDFARDFGQVVDCDQDPGNGSVIIHGPDSFADSNGEDRDNAFGSLTIHPADALTLLVGTERNGFLRSKDGGSTWTRHREGVRHQNGL